MLVNTWQIVDPKPTNIVSQTMNSIIFMLGQNITFTMKSKTDRTVRITVRVEKVNDKAAIDRRTGDLRLVIVESATISAGVRRRIR